MGETIKGISIVIDGDTTALTKALGNVNKESKSIQGELKQVEKLLKMDPGNVDLIAQKQKLLNDAVATTKQKLDALKSAQEQVNAQFAKGEISEGQFRAFQREIAATEQELGKLEGKLKDTGKTMAEIGEAAKNAGDKMKDVGEKLTVGVTAPIAAAGGLILKGAIDAENAQGKLQASLGLTAEEAADLEAVAKAVWVNGFGENIDEVNSAIASVRQNMGDLAEDDMQKVTEGAMTIADVFDQDVKEVAAAAGVAMKNFGIDGQQALDIITYGFQHGGDYSGELLDTIREYSPQFASLGLSADQAMAMLIKGAEAGSWNLDKVGDSMKEFNIRAQDGSKATSEGFAMIGMDAQEMGAAIAAGGDQAQKAFVATITALASMKDPLAQNQAGVALFGR
jgi:phage-related minor tail protein